MSLLGLGEGGVLPLLLWGGFASTAPSCCSRPLPAWAVRGGGIQFSSVLDPKPCGVSRGVRGGGGRFVFPTMWVFLNQNPLLPFTTNGGEKIPDTAGAQVGCSHCSPLV